MSKSIGTKPTEWQAAIAADASCLLTPASAKTVSKILSTAGSRAPQKQLCAAVQSHVAAMVSDAHGCDILSSLIEFGTKQTVATIIQAALPLIAAKSLTKPQAELVRNATRRPGCSEEADKAITGITKALLANLTLPHALVTVANLVSADPLVLSKYKFVAAIGVASKGDLNSFIQFAVSGAADKSAVGAALWKLLQKDISASVAEAIADAGRPAIDDIAEFVFKQKKISDSQWAPVVAACIRGAEESIASRITEVAMKGADATIIGAVQNRFPDQAFASPALAAVATQWSRSHLSAFVRTRETVNARIAQKRAREDIDEF